MFEKRSKKHSDYGENLIQKYEFYQKCTFLQKFAKFAKFAKFRNFRTLTFRVFMMFSEDFTRNFRAFFENLKFPKNIKKTQLLRIEISKNTSFTKNVENLQKICKICKICKKFPKFPKSGFSKNDEKNRCLPLKIHKNDPFSGVRNFRVFHRQTGHPGEKCPRAVHTPKNQNGKTLMKKNKPLRTLRPLPPQACYRGWTQATNQKFDENFDEKNSVLARKLRKHQKKTGDPGGQVPPPGSKPG